MQTPFPPICTALYHAQKALRDITETPTLDAELLLARALERDRSYLHAHPEATLNAAQCALFDKLSQRRARGEPLAYILGYKEFWSLNLRVTPHVLIPRPETELLVELALARIPERASWNIADLGTGSGAIALAIARERPDAKIVATDISEAALTLSAYNAKRLGIANIRSLAGDWFAPLTGRFHVIVSNPPYVAADDLNLQGAVLEYEPRAALISEQSGLADLSQIVKGAGTLLRPDGVLIVEHGFEQGEAMRTLFERSGFSGARTYRDLAGQERATLGVRQE